MSTTLDLLVGAVCIGMAVREELRLRRGAFASRWWQLLFACGAVFCAASVALRALAPG